MDSAVTPDPNRVDDCTADGTDVPSCSTGPTGRLRFVGRELADLWRELRGRDGSRRDAEKDDH